jgi:beta-N-acetylhexosaminidase
MCLLVVLSACASTSGDNVRGKPSATPGISPAPTASDCVDRIFAKLTPAQRVGQLIFVGLANNQLGPAEQAAIENHAVGAVWFTESSTAPITSVAAVSAQVQALTSATSGTGFLIGANQEGGEIDQFQGPGFSPIPSALQQGTMDPSTLESQAAAWGKQLRQAGINLNMAPVMDTVPPGQDQSNAPIGALQREYGHDPATVSAHGIAFMAGMHGSSVLATAKHFPGLGRVAVNTDYAADAVDDATSPNDPYLAPFREAVDAGVDLVMVSTARYTKIDPQHLAAFSPIVIDLLRSQLHFDGVIVADDLGGAVAVTSIPAGDRAVNFIAAGGDLITVKHADLVAPMTANVMNRAATDATFAAQVNAAAKRILRLKIRAGLAACSG